jgi:hypothetical protein
MKIVSLELNFFPSTNSTLTSFDSAIIMMDSTMVMTASFAQDTFWNPELYPIPQTDAIEFGGDYRTVPLDRGFLVSFLSIIALVPLTNSHQFENTPSHPNRHSDSITHAPGLTSLDWRGSQQEWGSVESTPSTSEPSQRLKMLLEPQPQPQRRTRKAPSGQALERRRKQNRAAQSAFRERSKKQVEEMRLELMQSTEFNQKMYMSVRELLDRTESLKRDMEAILAKQPPVISPDYACDSLELNTSPGSNSDYQNQEESGTIVVG